MANRAHFVVVPAARNDPEAAVLREVHEEVARHLNGVQNLFEQWSAEASTKRHQALASRAFEEESFELALLVFNKRGERRRGTRKAQDWYFAKRQSAASMAGQPCARCTVCVSRRDIYFVDRAKDWAKSDELCRQCMQCVMRQLLGEDDAAIVQEARSILESGWMPVVNPRLADALVEQRTFFSML